MPAISQSSSPASFCLTQDPLANSQAEFTPPMASLMLDTPQHTSEQQQQSSQVTQTQHAAQQQRSSQFTQEQMERWEVSKEWALETRRSQGADTGKSGMQPQGKIPSADDILAGLAPMKSAAAYQKAWDNFCDFLNSPQYSSVAKAAKQGKNSGVSVYKIL